MGKTYTHYKMVGAFVSGQMEDLYQFLKENGYPITEAQKKEISESEEFGEEIIEILNLGEMDIIIINNWSDDFVIGYHITKRRSQKSAKEEFAKYLPNVEAILHDFTQVS